MKKSKKKFIYIGGSLVLIILLAVAGLGYYKHSTDVDSGATKKEKAMQYEKQLTRSSCKLFFIWVVLYNNCFKIICLLHSFLLQHVQILQYQQLLQSQDGFHRGYLQ